MYTRQCPARGEIDALVSSCCCVADVADVYIVSLEAVWIVYEDARTADAPQALYSRREKSIGAESGLELAVELCGSCERGKHRRQKAFVCRATKSCIILWSALSRAQGVWHNIQIVMGITNAFSDDGAPFISIRNIPYNISY